MRALIRRLLRLFVDDGWLAGAALVCVVACLGLLRVRVSPVFTGCVLLLALVGTLAFSVQRGIRKRRNI